MSALNRNLKKSFTFSILSLFLMTSCASVPQLAKLPVPAEAPKDFAKNFEVKENPDPIVPGNNSPSEKIVPDQRSKLKKKKGRAKVEAMHNHIQDQKAGFDIPNRRPQKDPLWIGEKVTLDVSWLGTRAGEFFLEVMPFKYINGRKVYHLRGTARTTDIFALIYKAEDTVDSFVDYEGWFPYKFTLHGDESKHIRDHLELYDHQSKKQYINIVDNRIKTGEVVENKGYRDLTQFSQDSFSALYFLRTFKLEPGVIVRFPMTTSGKQWETEAHVLAREEVKTKAGTFKGLKVKVETKFNGMIQQKGDSYLWVSDDERKFLLKFEAKVRVGWITGILKNITLGKFTPEVDRKNSSEDAKNQSETLEFPIEQKHSGIEKHALPQEEKLSKRGRRTIERHKKWFKEVLKSFDELMNNNTPSEPAR